MAKKDVLLEAEQAANWLDISSSLVGKIADFGILTGDKIGKRRAYSIASVEDLARCIERGAPEGIGLIVKMGVEKVGETPSPFFIAGRNRGSENIRNIQDALDECGQDYDVASGEFIASGYWPVKEDFLDLLVGQPLLASYAGWHLDGGIILEAVDETFGDTSRRVFICRRFTAKEKAKYLGTYKKSERGPVASVFGV